MGWPLGMSSVADLKGHKVGGVAPNTGPTAVLQMALTKAGMTLAAIHGFNVVGPSQPAALERDAIEAAISYVPYSAETITAGTSRLITTASEVYGKTWPGGGVIVRPEFAKAHPDVVVDVLKLVARAERLLREKPDEAYPALAKVSKTSLKNVEYSYQNGLVAPTSVVPDKQAMMEQAKVLETYHVITVPSIQGFIDELVHPEFAKQALGQ